MLRALPLVILLALAILLAVSLSDKPKQSPQLGKAFSSFSLPILNSKKTLTEQNFAGNVTIINIFASWCMPCALEHDLLMKLSTKAKLYGIAWKDKQGAIKKYLRARGNPFTQIALDPNGTATLSFGLSGVPETFILDKNGIIRYHYPTAITEDELQERILPLIDKLSQEHAQ